jgi:hypothetical protein
MRTPPGDRLCQAVNAEIGVMRDKDFLESARECFRQAAAGTNPKNMRLLVELGLEYLRLAPDDPHLAERESGDLTRFRFH